MWLGGFKSHLLAETLLVLMHINETVLSHSDRGRANGLLIVLLDIWYVFKWHK